MVLTVCNMLQAVSLDSVCSQCGSPVLAASSAPVTAGLQYSPNHCCLSTHAGPPPVLDSLALLHDAVRWLCPTWHALSTSMHTGCNAHNFTSGACTHLSTSAKAYTNHLMLDTIFDHKHRHDICILTSVCSQCCPHLQVRPLEMFFPFDPYLLRRSARFLKLPSSYNTWGGGPQHDTDASHLSSDDELEVLEGMQGFDACLLLLLQLRAA